MFKVTRLGKTENKLKEEFGNQEVHFLISVTAIIILFLLPLILLINNRLDELALQNKELFSIVAGKSHTGITSDLQSKPLLDDFINNSPKIIDSTSRSLDFELMLESSSIKKLPQYQTDEYIIAFSNKELDMLVQAIQHEVTCDEAAFPYEDLDKIQQCMARVIINQVLDDEFKDTIYGVLSDPGHFMPLENLVEFDPHDERTLKNAMIVLKGEDSHSSKIFYEGSFKSFNLKNNLAEMEFQVGHPVKPYLTTVTSENRLFIFAERAEPTDVA